MVYKEKKSAELQYMEWQYYDCVKLLKVYKEIEMYYNQYNELRSSNEFILEVPEEGLGLMEMLPSTVHILIWEF